jgi:hypothetical protein
MNHSEMLLAKENRRKYYEYLKLFKKEPKKVDKIAVLQEYE